MSSFFRGKPFVLKCLFDISDCCLLSSDCPALTVGDKHVCWEPFLLVTVFMNQWEYSQQVRLSPTVRALLHSKSRTVRAEETTVRDTKETFQKKTFLEFLFMRFH